MPLQGKLQEPLQPSLQPALLPNVLAVAVEAQAATIDLSVPHSAWFEGHFDNEPVLPGLVLILWAKAAFAEHFSQAVHHDIPRVKFRRVIGPEARLQLRLKIGRRLTFAYYAPDGGVVCSGEFKPAPTTTEVVRDAR